MLRTLFTYPGVTSPILPAISAHPASFLTHSVPQGDKAAQPADRLTLSKRPVVAFSATTAREHKVIKEAYSGPAAENPNNAFTQRPINDDGTLRACQYLVDHPDTGAVFVAGPSSAIYRLVEKYNTEAIRPVDFVLDAVTLPPRGRGVIRIRLKSNLSDNDTNYQAIRSVFSEAKTGQCYSGEKMTGYRRAINHLAKTRGERVAYILFKPVFSPTTIRNLREIDKDPTQRVGDKKIKIDLKRVSQEHVAAKIRLI